MWAQRQLGWSTIIVVLVVFSLRLPLLPYHNTIRTTSRNAIRPSSTMMAVHCLLSGKIEPSVDRMQ